MSPSAPAPAPKSDLSVIAVVGVGPGDGEIPRLNDLLDAIAFHEPACSHVVAVNDPGATGPRDLAGLIGPRPSGPALVVVEHPGHSAKEGWSSGLGMGLLAGLKWVSENADPACVLKLDTDSMVIGPFARKLADRFAADERLGMLGVARVNVDGRKRRPELWGRRVKSLRWPLWIRPRSMVNDNWTGIVRLGLGRDKAYVRSMINRALASPHYVHGDHCQGGGYAWSRRMIHALKAAGDFERIGAWHNTFLAEDVMQGILAHARGLTIDDFCKPGEVFGIDWKGLPLPPETLVEQGFAVVHSLRNDEHHSEDELRARFRELTGRPSPNAPTAAAG